VGICTIARTGGSKPRRQIKWWRGETSCAALEHDCKAAESRRSRKERGEEEDEDDFGLLFRLDVTARRELETTFEVVHGVHNGCFSECLLQWHGILGYKQGEGAVLGN
jgi:hypothetical protein